MSNFSSTLVHGPVVDQENLPIFDHMELDFVALLYMIVFVLYIIPYLICIYVIINAKDLIAKPYYQILLSMGLADIVQILNSLFSCIFTLTENREPFWTNKMAGALTCGCWFVYCFLAHVMAVNRFVSMYFPLKVNQYFSPCVTKVAVGAAWAYGLAWMFALAMPWCTFMFFIEFYTWDYAETPGSSLARLLNFASDIFHVTVLIIWYTLIFAKLKHKLNQIDIGLQSQSNNHFNHHRGPVIKKREILVLIQASILCLMVVFTIVGFYVVPILTNSKWATMIMNIVWISTAGMNAVVYIAFNSRIRRDFIVVVYRIVGKKASLFSDGSPTTINNGAIGPMNRH